MIAFWIAAALLAACGGALILSGAARVRAGSLTLDPAVSVYRRALLEIEELAERDLLAPRERSEVRAEAARRLLSAAERTDRPLAPTGRPVGALAAAVLVGVSALLIYLWVGSPGAPDQPFAARLAAWRATPESSLPSNWPPPSDRSPPADRKTPSLFAASRRWTWRWAIWTAPATPCEGPSPSSPKTPISWLALER